MLAKFDPVTERQNWLKSPHWEPSFDPETTPVEARAINAGVTTSRLIQAYFLGLGARVRPKLKAIADWMETHPTPDRTLVLKAYGHWQAGWASDYIWWKTLGLCKWLSRGEASENEFAKGLAAEWDAWQHASQAEAAESQWERQRELGGRLALALAGNNPEFGLKLYEAADVRDPTEDDLPLLQFGHWACLRLAAGGKRDVEFVARGAEMLRASLLPNFFFGADRTQPALWLKAIYWDSGVVRTPEQAFAKAYESMPGIVRPDFVPG